MWLIRELLTALAVWVDGSYLKYILPAVAAFGLMLFLSFQDRFVVTDKRIGRVQRFLAHPVVFAISCLSTLIMFRWPALLIDHALNPDEAAFLAGALTLKQNPLFYVSLNSTSSGLFNYYILLAPIPLLGGINYFSARLIALFLTWVILLLLHRVIRLFSGETLARLAIVPTLMLFCVVKSWDWVDYNAEYFPVALLVLSFYLVLRFSRENVNHPRRDLYVLGVVLGFIPFTKLQAIPVAMVIGMFAILVIFLVHGFDFRRLINRLTSLGIGVFTTPILVLLYLLIVGKFQLFWMSYIKQQLAYKSSGYYPTIWHNLADFPNFLIMVDDFDLFTKAMVYMSVVSLLVGVTCKARINRKTLFSLVMFATVTVSSFYVVLAPNRHFPHYLLFLVAPVALTPFMLQAAFSRSLQKTHALLLSLFFILFIYNNSHRFTLENQFLRSAPYYGERCLTKTSRIIRQLAPNGGSMVVWGWMDLYYVETGLGQGTRENNPNVLLLNEFDDFKDYYLKGYLERMEETRPEVILEAMAPHTFLYKNRKASGIDTIPEIKAYVDRNYKLYGEVEKMRLFVRKDLPIPDIKVAEGFDPNFTNSIPVDTEGNVISDPNHPDAKKVVFQPRDTSTGRLPKVVGCHVEPIDQETLRFPGDKDNALFISQQWLSKFNALSFWVKPAKTQHVFATLLSNHVATDSRGFGCELKGTNDKTHLFVSGLNSVVSDNLISIPPDKWTLIVVRFGKNETTLTCHAAGSGSFEYERRFPFEVGRPVLIGNWKGWGRGLTGTLSDLTVWKTTPSREAINQMVRKKLEAKRTTRVNESTQKTSETPE